MKSLELIQTASGNYTVIAGGMIADSLCKDEALGVVAHHIFGDGTPHPYLKSYVEWLRWHKKYHDEYREPVALLPEKPSNLIPFNGHMPEKRRPFPFQYHRELGAITFK